MDLMDKLKILSNAAKYDVSCSSSGSKRKNKINGIGNASESGICHSFTPDGRCISLLKILFSNDCIYDCKYCINGYSKDFQRVSFTPNEVCDLTINFYRSNSLKLLAPQKSKEKILLPMKTIKNSIINHTELKKNIKSTPLFVPGGQSTQLIVGATPESDYKILNLTQSLYDRFKLKRVYFSAYVPVIKDNPLLPQITHPPMVREHRLYQADWLLRFYGFKASELLKNENDNFDLNFDPKTYWALNNFNEFPIEINKASYETLLRIPGIGVTSARRIIKTRRVCRLTYEDLKRLGIVLKRAKYFITCSGKYYGDVAFDDYRIKKKLLSQNTKKNSPEPNQISFFDDYNNDNSTSSGIILPSTNINILSDRLSSFNGEL